MQTANIVPRVIRLLTDQRSEDPGYEVGRLQTASLRTPDAFLEGEKRRPEMRLLFRASRLQIEHKMQTKTKTANLLSFFLSVYSSFSVLAEIDKMIAGLLVRS